MIFGFNTDVKHGDTIYHVQSEAREGELLLQTQVFVRGRCIGKKATSYAASEGQPGDTQKEQQLREQHVWFSTPSGKASWTMFWIIPSQKCWRAIRSCASLTVQVTRTHQHGRARQSHRWPNRPRFRCNQSPGENAG